MSFTENLTRAFKHKNYRHYFFWQFLSFAGTWMQSTAQSWLIYKLTGSALFMGFLNFAATLPALFLTPFAGVVADKFQRRKVLLTTQILCLVQGIILVTLYYSGTITKWHVLFLAILLGIANSFDVTARQSFIPLLINKKDLLNAIALNSSMFNAARILGPAVAGILIASKGEGICFILNVFSYIPIIIFLLLVKAKKQEIKEFSSPMFHLKEGMSYAWNTMPIRSLLIMVGTASFWGMSFTTFMPIFADQILHSGSKGLGMLMCSSGVGAVIGGLFLASRQKIYNISNLICLSLIVLSISLFMFSLSTNIFLSMFLLCLTGFSFMIISAGSNTSMQSMAPDYLRGRVVSLYSMMFMGMFPLGSLIVGVIANKVNVQFACQIGATFSFIIGLYFLFRLPELNRESNKIACDKEAAGYYPLE